MNEETPRTPSLRSLVHWPDDKTVVVDGYALDVRDLGEHASPGRLRLMKPRSVIDRYVDLLDDLRPQRIVEAGIYQGGSTALFAQLLRPERMISFDISPTPVALLEQMLVEHGHAGRVTTHHGIDQTDAAALADLLGTEPYDLILDDASHVLDLTRCTFDLLFPLLRPGGVYVVEDWGWGLFPFSPPPGTPVLSVLAIELLMTLPWAEDLIDDININAHWAAIRRSSKPLDLTGWSLARTRGELGSAILAAAESAAVQAVVPR